MSLVVSQAGPGGRVGELALWGAAGLVMLTVHFGAAAYLMREQPEVLADNAPPAAIMIELAPEPESANTQEEQISPDMQEQEQVLSETPPVEEPQPDPIEKPQPEPEPMPQEIAEPIEPEPVQPPMMEPPPEPEPQVTETIPEPLPEPIEEFKPIEEQMTAALDNVEVPLPAMRPLPPPVAEKPPEQPKSRSSKGAGEEGPEAEATTATASPAGYGGGEDPGQTIGPHRRQPEFHEPFLRVGLAATVDDAREDEDCSIRPQMPRER